MHARMPKAILVAAATLLAAGCASSEEWMDWRGHSTHFASGQHATFSLRNNKDGSNPRVSRGDIEAARSENWWGKAITVSPEQIFQN